MIAENQIKSREIKDIWIRRPLATGATTLVTSQETADHKIPITLKHRSNVSTAVYMDILRSIVDTTKL